MFKVTARYDLVTERTHNQIMREALEETMFEYHHRVVVQDSFNQSVKQRPHFRKRSIRWNKAKAKLIGSIIPNVLTGLLKDWAFKTNSFRFTSTKNSARMVSKTPNIPSTNIRTYGSGRNKKYKLELDGRTRTSLSLVQRKEIETPTLSELHEESDYFKEAYSKLANKPSNRRKRTKKL